MDDALAGTRVLVAGGEGDTARALGARLATGAAQVTVARDAEAAAQAALAAQTVGRRRDVEALRVETLRRLALAAEYRDDNTREHTERVAALAAHLGRRLGLSELAVTHVRHAAPLHDVGKIAIPTRSCSSPGGSRRRSSRSSRR